MRPVLREQTKDQVTADILTGMVAWRQQHPKATLREIEAELDQRWAQVRARMVEDLALASTAADWRDAPPAEQPTCPDCHVPLRSRSADTRRLHTQGGQSVTLERRYGVCPACGAGLFPP